MLRRTTVVAEDDDLTLLARVAKDRGTSLGRFLGGLVAAQAEQLRRDRHPRVALFSADVSVASAMETDDPAGRPFRD